MRTEIFMWILTALGVVAFVVLLVRRIISTPEDSEDATERTEPVIADEQDLPVGVRETSQEELSPIPAYMGDAVRLFRSLLKHWQLFTAAVFVLVVTSAIPLLLYTRGNLSEYFSINTPPQLQPYLAFVVGQMKDAFLGLNIVFKIVRAVGSYPLCLFVALDLYSLKDSPDASVRWAARKYSKLIVLGVLPWAAILAMSPTGEISRATEIAVELFQIMMYLLGAVATALAEGYFFGYAYAFLKGSDNPHPVALRLALEKFRPLYIFNLVLLIIPLIHTSINAAVITLIGTLDETTILHYMDVPYYVSMLIVIALFMSPPLIVAGNKGVKESIVGALRAVMNNIAAYIFLLCVLVAIEMTLSVVTGTLFKYILLKGVGVPAVYVITSSLLGMFATMAISAFCLCILVAFYMRQVHEEQSVKPATSAPAHLESLEDNA